MRVIVTGSRSLEDSDPVFAMLQGLWQFHGAGEFTVVEGGARGADAFAARWAKRSGYEPETHKADWEGSCDPDSGLCQPDHRRKRPDGSEYCPTAGLRRNQKMADLGADLCLAVVNKPLQMSAGTADMVDRASGAGIPVWVVHRLDGST